MSKARYALAVTVVAAVAAGSYWLGRSQTAAEPQAAAAQSGKIPGKVLFYRHPMNPSVTSPVPAKDEMGMDYVPVYADEGTGATPGTVTIDPGIVQSMGVRTAPAVRRAMTRQIRTVGRVDYDEQGLSHVHLRSEGWVEKLFVAETGQIVRAGEPLLALYSPLIVSTEQEYRLALRGVAALNERTPPSIAEQARALLASSAERLRLLDVPEAELRRLQGGGDIRREITLTAPESGIVQFIGAREGQFLSAQADVFRIADLSTVWVLADLYEDEVPWVQVGDRAELRLRGLPGPARTARVDYIYPYLDSKTRTQRLRLVLDNPDGTLKPGMYADVTIHSDRRLDAVVVPDAAIVRSGTRAQLFVQRAPGRFEPREVALGVAADGEVQILQGVEPGETVVVSGQFLIDSESKLREAAVKMMPQAGSAPAAAAPDQGAMPMEAEPPSAPEHSHPEPSK